MAENLGFVEPDARGRLSWPLRAMNYGDWFVVRASDRHIEDVRNLVKVRSTQIGRPREYRVEATADGDAKVMRGDRVTLAIGKQPHLLAYSQMRRKLTTLYRFDANAVPWEVLGRRTRYDAPLMDASIELRWFVADMKLEHPYRVGLIFEDDGFWLERVADDETTQSFALPRYLLS